MPTVGAHDAVLMAEQGWQFGLQGGGLLDRRLGSASSYPACSGYLSKVQRNGLGAALRRAKKAAGARGDERY